LLSVFNELSSTRQYIQGTPQTITYQEIQSWCYLTGNTLTPFEISSIQRIDRAFINKITEMQQQQQKEGN
jgi:hypothetical protein